MTNAYFTNNRSERLCKSTSLAVIAIASVLYLGCEQRTTPEVLSHPSSSNPSSSAATADDNSVELGAGPAHDAVHKPSSSVSIQGEVRRTWQMDASSPEECLWLLQVGDDKDRLHAAEKLANLRNFENHWHQLNQGHLDAELIGSYPRVTVRPAGSTDVASLAQIAAPILRSATQDELPLVRVRAVKAMALMQQETLEAVGILRHELDSADAETSLTIIDAFRSIGPAASSVAKDLIAVAEKSSPPPDPVGIQMRLAVMKALESFGEAAQRSRNEMSISI